MLQYFSIPWVNPCSPRLFTSCFCKRYLSSGRCIVEVKAQYRKLIWDTGLSLSFLDVPNQTAFYMAA